MQTQNQESASSYFIYEDLLRTYKTALVDNLRGFGLGKDILDLWVPNEDICKSLSDLLFAAKANDAKSIRLSFSQSNMSVIDEVSIREMLNENYPHYEMFSNGCNVFLEVLGLLKEKDAQVYEKKLIDKVVNLVPVLEKGEIFQNTAIALRQPESINDIYSRNLLLLSGKNNFFVYDQNEADTISSDLDGLCLKIKVNPKNGIILSANYAGDRTEVATRLSRILCGLIIGFPLVEVANHGMMRLENFLREESPEFQSPIKGIFFPERVDPAFLFFGELCRQLLINLKKQSALSDENSDYDDQPSNFWLQSSDAQKREQLNLFFQKEFAGEHIEVVAIEYHVRIVIDLQNPTGEKLLKIEKLIKKRVDSRLEVFLAEIQDKNKLRSSRILKIGEKS